MPTNTTLATLTLEIARSYLGTAELPPGSNRGPDVDLFLRSVGLDPASGRYPWCAAFVSFCIQQAAQQLNITPKFRGSAGALRLLQKNPGLVLPTPVPNCIGVIDHGKGKGHAFFIYALGVDDPGQLFTIDGNSDADTGSRTGGSVVLLDSRRVEDCAGFLEIA